MKQKREMTYDELVQELKNMKGQIQHHRLLTKEMHRLDCEYWLIHNKERNGSLPFIELPKCQSKV
tara:strand:- start:854 stop:1048 length:195 start_codon:yes stop_codon:yes gene_type:complete